MTGNRDSSSAKYKCVPFSTTQSTPVIPFLADIFVPPGTCSGLYKGTINVVVRRMNCITMHALTYLLTYLLCIQTDHRSVAVMINMKVWAFTLPLKPSQQSAFGVWGDNDNWMPENYSPQMKNFFIMTLEARIEELIGPDTATHKLYDIFSDNFSCIDQMDKEFYA